MRWILEKKSDDSGEGPVRASRHPLPWRNEPSGGENHVADANGRPVYDGFDAAEMFRLYGDEAQAERGERTTARHVRAARRWPGRRPRRTT
jgi:hypothetical protein